MTPAPLAGASPARESREAADPRENRPVQFPADGRFALSPAGT